MSDSVESFISWGRYLYWADILFQRFNTFVDAPDVEGEGKRQWRFLAFMSQWFASLWVVTEGWQELGLTDPIIQELIRTRPEFCERLRRFRNGVFHYQPKIFDNRFISFLSGNEDHFFWAWSLHYEFKRYLWEWPEKLGATDELTQDLRNTLEQAIGWFPKDVIPAMKDGVKKIIREGREAMTEGQDFASAAAKELLAALNEAEQVAESVPGGPIYDLLVRFIKQQ